MTPALRMPLIAVLALLAAPGVARAAPVARPSDAALQRQLASFVEAKSDKKLRLEAVAPGGGRSMQHGNVLKLQDGYELDFVATVRFEAGGFTARGADEFAFEDLEVLAAPPRGAAGRPPVAREKGDRLDVVGSALFGQDGKLVRVRVSRAAPHADGQPQRLALYGKVVAVAERMGRIAQANAPDCAKIGAALMKHANEDLAVAREMRAAKSSFVDEHRAEQIYGPRMAEANQGQAALEACQDHPSLQAYARKLGR